MLNPKVNFYFEKASKWQEEVNLLRTIFSDMIAAESGLTEDLKWGQPCYTLQNKNIVLIHDFKEYCALLFFKGVLLNDEHHLLIQQSENVQSAKQMRFTTIQEILAQKTIIKAYVFEAIAVEKAGLKVELKKTTEFVVAEKFQQKLDTFTALKTAFEALTPGRQRAYLLHFSQPKQSKTRESRIEKCIPQILKGKGLNDD